MLGIFAFAAITRPGMVLKTAVKGHRDLVTVVGHLAFAIPGEFLEASGRWAIDRDHGQQFKADSIRTTHPGSPEGMERYLGSGFVKGVGPHFAAKLVEMFGDKVFEIIEQQPERLTEVHGIGKTRQERIASSWHEQRVVREIMVFLHSYGVGTARAVRIYKTYGDDAIGIVRVNPYRLAHDIRGIGFKTADDIAERLGIERNSPLQAQAGVGYVLMELTGEGHCAFPEDQLVNKTSELLGIDEGIVCAAVEHEIGEGSLIKAEVQRFGHVYRVADKVLHVQNDYSKEVFNGDLGIIKAVKADDSEVHVSFDGRAAVYDFGELDELMPDYAMSIHNSQGSEFPAVVIPVHTQHYMMLQRNLIYTGVTRGKSLVVLVGTTKAVALSVKRADANRRYCGLKRRLEEVAALV